MRHDSERGEKRYSVVVVIVLIHIYKVFTHLIFFILSISAYRH